MIVQKTKGRENFKEDNRQDLFPEANPWLT